MNKQEKAERVQVLRDIVEQATAIILLNFKGLSVEESTSLRRNLRKEGGAMTVVKNTLLRRALQGTQREFLKDHLKGPVAMAYTTQDPVALAKVLDAHLKDSQSLVPVAGSLDGKPLAAEDIKSLARMPTMETMRAMFLGLLLAVPRKFMAALTAAQRDFVAVLKAKERQLEEGAEG